MADAAFHLARVLLAEIHFNQVEFTVDGAGSDFAHQIAVRRATVAKVLESEFGITCEFKVSRVVEFLPGVVAFEPIPVSTYAELADFIRKNVRLQPGEPPKSR